LSLCFFELLDAFVKIVDPIAAFLIVCYDFVVSEIVVHVDHLDVLCRNMVSSVKAKIVGINHSLRNCIISSMKLRSGYSIVTVWKRN
jgi:hypothetical protein